VAFYSITVFQDKTQSVLNSSKIRPHVSGLMSSPACFSAVHPW